jgi:nucleoside-diphosphate-sugar epimerase
MNVVSASKRVLITGREGFTGYYLQKHLKQEGFEIIGTSQKNDATFVSLDITQKESVIAVLKAVTPDYIINLAGISYVGHGSALDFYNVNTIGAHNLLEAIVEIGYTPKKIILASSATVYGNQHAEVLTETLCPKPVEHYGISKYAMECIASQYFDMLPIIIARPFNYTGKGQSLDFVIPKIVQHYKEKRDTIDLGNIHVAREFNSVHYVCQVYSKLLASDARSFIVNICTGRVVTLENILAIMNEIAGYTITVQTNPALVRHNEIPVLRGSLERLYSVIGTIEDMPVRDLLKEMYVSE